jgi:hypothetical protein
LRNRVGGLIRALLANGGPGQDAGVSCAVAAGLKERFDGGEARPIPQCRADVQTGIDGSGLRGAANVNAAVNAPAAAKREIMVFAW